MYVLVNMRLQLCMYVLNALYVIIIMYVRTCVHAACTCIYIGMYSTYYDTERPIPRVGMEHLSKDTLK